MGVGCISIVNKLGKKRGLTLVELVVVLVIVAVILVGFGAAASTNVKRANRSDVENELNVMATNLSDAYYDLGNPNFPVTDEGETNFKEFLKILESEYLGVSFDMSSIQRTTNGFYIEIAEPLDVYEQRYKCWFVTVAKYNNFAMICSGGDDLIVSQEKYKDGDYSDDIVLIIYPKAES